MRKRIWEVDALRGLCILGMIVVHFVFDITMMYGISPWESPVLAFFMNWGGVLFLVISGVSATLGSKSVRRGFVVFSCGMLCTAVTAGMYLLGLANVVIIIYFGVLHCLGICMILWHLLKKLPSPVLLCLGIVLAAVGLWLRTVYVAFPYLIPLGLITPSFSSSDYFPLLPNLGFFLLGAVLGRKIYHKKESLLPKVNAEISALRFLRFCGRHSLLIYLLHQPVLTALCTLFLLFTR